MEEEARLAHQVIIIPHKWKLFFLLLLLLRNRELSANKKQHAIVSDQRRFIFYSTKNYRLVYMEPTYYSPLISLSLRCHFIKTGGKVASRLRHDGYRERLFLIGKLARRKKRRAEMLTRKQSRRPAVSTGKRYSSIGWQCPICGNHLEFIFRWDQNRNRDCTHARITST